MKLDPIPGPGNENLFRHPATGIIYFRKFKAGRGRVERSTGTIKIGEARKRATEFLAELLGEKKPERARKLIEDLFPAWIEQKKSTCRIATIKSMELSWSNLKPLCGPLLPTDISPAWWESTYIPKMKVKKPERKFFNDRKWLSMFLYHCCTEGFISSVPRLKNPDTGKSPGKVYTDDEIDQLLLHTERDLELQILMGLTMGMRMSEIMLLSWDRVDLKNRLIHLYEANTKTKKGRSIGISDPVLFLLRGKKRKGPWVFPNPTDPSRPQGKQGNKRAWTTCRQKAGVKGRFHDLRHTFLTKAFRAPGSNPALICEYAGLALEVAQKIYLHFTPEDTRSIASIVRIG